MADFLNIFYQFDQKMWSDRIRLDARQAPELADFGIGTWKMSKLLRYEPKQEKEKKQHLPTKNFETLQHNRPFGHFFWEGGWVYLFTHHFDYYFLLNDVRYVR